MLQPFELRSIPDDRNRGRLFLLQLPCRTKYLVEVAQPVTIARLDGTALEAAVEPLTNIMRAYGLSEQAVHDLLTSNHAVPLAEELAIRLGLVFNAINTLRSGAKVATAVRRAEAMSVDEGVFWLKKLIAEDSPTDAHRRALLMILTE